MSCGLMTFIRTCCFDMGRAFAVQWNYKVMGRIQSADVAKLITCLHSGPYMMKVLSKYIPANVLATVVPTWVDTDFIRPISKANNPFARAHGQQDKFTVMYSGNLGETHDIAAILTAARELRDRADIHFMIIGSGPQWHSIASSVEVARDPNISVLPLQPSEVYRTHWLRELVFVVSMGRGVEGIQHAQ